MADPLISDVSGLQLSNNTFSASPPGAQLVAENIVISQKGVGEPRRGQDRAFQPPTASEIPFAMAEFQGELLINSAPSKLSTSYSLGFADHPTVDFTDGPWNPVDADGTSIAYGRMKFGYGGTFLYFCASTGPKCLETTADQPRAAGLLRMPDLDVAMVNPAVPGWLPYGYTAAYQSVLRRPTSSGASLLSPPSGRAIITNRILAPVGTMTRSGGNLVTVTLPGTENPGLVATNTFALTPGDADFAAGSYTVASVTGNVVTYSDAGANVSNTVAQNLDTGPRATTLTVKLSEDATVETPVRIYRSKATTATSPGDEMFLVGEVNPSGSDISNGYLLFDDGTPESVIFDPLYTNPQTGDGAQQANYAPPIYRDVASWGERTWYANTTGLQTMRLQMLGVGAPDGVQAGDTFQIDTDDGPIVLTFVNTFSVVGDVEITSFSDDPTFNIQQTAQTMCLQINSVADSFGLPVRAYYNGTQNQAPGAILLQLVEYGQDPMGITASRPAAWVPALASGSATFSTAERIPNGLSYSKLGQPESVPVVNFTAVGSKNYAIARILGLQQALLVFKEGDGIYSVTGQAPFQVQQISTANIIAPDCCALLSDAAWVYTDQGILRVSDSGGATVVSRPIETELNSLRAQFVAATYAYSFAVPYEVERRIMFFVPFDVDGAVPEMRAWCYSNATQSWSGPLVFENNVYSGTVSPSLAQLYLGGYHSIVGGDVTLERKTQTFLDYADSTFPGSVTEVNVDGNPLVLRLTDDPLAVYRADFAAGDGFYQGGQYTKIRQLRPDLGDNCVELYEAGPWSVASCIIFKHYDVTIQFQPSGTPSTRKALTRLTWLFKPEWFANLAGKTLLLTDQMQADLEIDSIFAGFGLNPFGVGPFGNPGPQTLDVNPIDAKWTNAAQFFPGLRLSEVWCKLRLQGVGMKLEPATAPAGRGK